MRMSVELPDPKPHGMEMAMAHQLAEMQRQLMGLVKAQAEQQTSLRTDVLKVFQQQQASFLDTLETFLKAVSQAPRHSPMPDGLVDAVRGLKQAMVNLPSTLQTALDTQYQTRQHQMVAPSMPAVTVQMPTGLLNRIDSLEAALLNGLRRSRSRTFGSNY